MREFFFKKSIELNKCFVLIQGLEYLHKSPLLSHGTLKSSSCLVDARWVLKINGFGQHVLTSHRSKQEDIGEYEKYNSMLMLCVVCLFLNIHMVMNTDLPFEYFQLVVDLLD